MTFPTVNLKRKQRSWDLSVTPVSPIPRGERQTVHGDAGVFPSNCTLDQRRKMESDILHSHHYKDYRERLSDVLGPFHDRGRDTKLILSHCCRRWAELDILMIRFRYPIPSMNDHCHMRPHSTALVEQSRRSAWSYRTKHCPQSRLGRTKGMSGPPAI